MPPEPSLLRPLRRAIDATDDGLLLMVAVRRALVGAVAQVKQGAGLRRRDPVREHQVLIRAQRVASRVGVPRATARAVMASVIADACQQQGLAPDLDQGGGDDCGHIMAAEMLIESQTSPIQHRLLRWLPPPMRLRPLLRVLPESVQRSLLQAAMARVLVEPISSGALDFMQGRRLGIEVSDLGLHWVIELSEGRLQLVAAPAEATVRGTATDLLLLVSRREDADTLFFQRRLTLTGDTELGLTARNLLERLPWEAVPLGLRIVLDRGARVAAAARAAHSAPA